MSIPTERSWPIGKNSRACSVVKATSVPIEIAAAPETKLWPANQYTSAGMIAKVIWIVAITQRPAMRWRTSRSASRDDSRWKRSASSRERPIVFPSSTPETDRLSSTSDEMSAMVR
jgi:hypothetical protein